MREIVIDLSAVDAEPAPPRRRRWLTALTVSLLTLVGAPAAEPAPEPFFHRLMWIEAPAQNLMALSPDLLVLHERGRSLVAYTLQGRPAWRRDFSGLQLKGASIRDGSVVVTAIDLPSSEDRTIFIDPATGAEKWRADGNASVVDGYIVVNSRGPQPRLRVLHAHNRAEVCRLPADRVLQGLRPGTVYSLGPGGVFTEHDLATGVPRRALTLSPTGLDHIFLAAGEDYAEIVRLDRQPAGRTSGVLSLVDFYTGKGQPLLRWQQVAPGAEGEGPRFLVRNRIGETAADFAELRSGGLALAGALPIAVSTCQHTGEVMACVTAGQKAGVWRIRTPARGVR